MASFDKQKNKLHEFLKERKYHLSLFGYNPGDDWKLILLTFLFVLGLISASGILTYQSLIQISEENSTDVSGDQKIIEIEKVDTVIERFVK